jgi:hypothetical protein
LRVVFILSTNYAGSHLLSELLGAHPNIRSIGELRNFEKLTSRKPENEEVESDYGLNPLFENLSSYDPREWHSILFKRLQSSAPHINVLVDNSKKVDWVKRCVLREDFEPVFIHLIRDPRALVHRWTVTSRTSMRTERIRIVRSSFFSLPLALFGRGEDVLKQKWLNENKNITNFLKSGPKSHVVVTYEDLVTKTEGVLRKIMPVLGEKFDHDQLNFGRESILGTRKKRYATQNKNSVISADLRWQSGRSAINQRIFTCVDIREYFRDLGIFWGENGPTSFQES